MKNTFGENVSLTLWGESHGAEIGAVLDGLAPGIAVDEAYIAARLALRRPAGGISTARREPDPFVIVSGVYRGRTTGTPLCIRIPNTDAHSADYAPSFGAARPGHADYTGYVKYHGFADPRGGGHFSGRLTAALVAAGAILMGALERKNIVLATHIRRCAGVDDAPFSESEAECRAQIARLNRTAFAVLDEAAGERMKREITAAAADGDSVGGVLETAVVGMPAGVGEPWFDTVEGVLAHALFSIPAVKGVEFGWGFAGSDARGSAYNDPMRMDGTRVVTETNHGGGIGGGITNGMPLVYRCAVKPTPSIARTQRTVDVRDHSDTEITAAGRHDPAIVHRARAAADSVSALALCDLLCGRFGTDWLREEQ